MRTIKPVEIFNREADENDSRGVKREAGVTILGAEKPVYVSRDAFLDSVYMGDHYTKDDDGSLVYKTDKLTVRISETEDKLKLHTVATRGEAPVMASFDFAKQGAYLILTKGYIHHKNPKLDNQHVNSPKMLRFSLEAAYKEVRRILDPEWLKGMADAYYADQANNTKTQADFLPVIAIRPGQSGMDEITFAPPANAAPQPKCSGNCGECKKSFAFIGH